ncbi:glycosyltransferase family 2 protein [Flavobacterium algicola]|uniref:glycosyltransferase family 2 protein n=1 Tax=Flavobacterium algicola TaxID=556529 RepID=UPI001EFDF71C|nr:glycosyltransferase family 2 protein [Flavobacterium algicola]MCG9793525.1 glycosyltransferase [Flavobacterium algicola]
METTVIIGVYNNIDYVVETIDSVKLQSYADWHCIIIDNDSPDNSYDLIKEVVDGDSRFSYFKKKNEGPSACRNFGISKIVDSPKYIHFLDGDDLLDVNFLQIMCSYLENNLDVGLVGCQFNSIDVKSNFLQKEFRSRIAKNWLGLPKSLKSTEYNTPFISFFSATGMGPFAVFRADVFMKTTGYEFDFWSHEDADIFCQMALLAKIHYIPYHLYNKRIHSHNLTSSSMKNYVQFREKWDVYFSSEIVLNNKIEEAVKYYYCIHAPIRDLKVALITFKILLKNGRDDGQIKWMSELLKSCVNNLIFRRNYKEIIKRRRLAV